MHVFNVVQFSTGEYNVVEYFTGEYNVVEYSTGEYYFSFINNFGALFKILRVFTIGE